VSSRSSPGNGPTAWRSCSRPWADPLSLLPSWWLGRGLVTRMERVRRWWHHLDRMAIRCREHPLGGAVLVAVSGDGQVALVDQGVVPPAQQDGVVGAGVPAVVPPQAVVDLSDTGWGSTARVLGGCQLLCVSPRLGNLTREDV